MRRAWIVGVAVLGSVALVAIAICYRSRHLQGPPSLEAKVPPSLEAKDCALAASDELPNARFARSGGRAIRPIKVWREGTALTVDNVAQGRDLRLYDRLELADPKARTVVDRRRDPILAKARSFLWEHWRDRKRAYLILTLSSVDATSSSHVFIEKDEIGRWRVYWRMVRDFGEVDDAPTAYAVGWVLPGGWNKPGTPLAQGQQHDPVRHSLEFRDVCGDVERVF